MHFINFAVMENYTDYNLSDVEAVLTNPTELKKRFEPFLERRYHLKQLEIDRNTYLNWEHLGLIPYERPQKGWRKFSFVESICLKTIQEFRSLGVSLHMIKKVKEQFWSDSMIPELKETFFKAVEAGNDHAFKKEILELYNNPNISLQQWEEVIRENCADYFGLTVFSTVITKSNVGIAITSSSEIGLLITSNIPESILEVQTATNNLILNSSFVSVNIYNLILSLSSSDKIKMTNEGLFYKINRTELEIINAIKSGKYTEIIIEVKNGEPIHLQYKQDDITSEVIKKVAPFLRKGSYTDIQLKARDGQLFTFSQTEHKKLK